MSVSKKIFAGLLLAIVLVAGFAVGGNIVQHKAGTCDTSMPDPC